MVERLFRGPFAAQHIEILVGPGIALDLGGNVAILGHLVIGAAGDDVHRHPSARQLIECGELARGDGRLGKARPMRDQEAELAGDRGGMGRDDLAFWRVGAERHQHPIKAPFFLRARRGLDIITVERADLAQAMDLAFIVEADIADELDGHGWSSFAVGIQMTKKPWVPSRASWSTSPYSQSR